MRDKEVDLELKLELELELEGNFDPRNPSFNLPLDINNLIKNNRNDNFSEELERKNEEEMEENFEIKNELEDIEKNGEENNNNNFLIQTNEIEEINGEMEEKKKVFIDKEVERRKEIEKSIWKPYYYLLKDNPSYRFLYFANVISRFGDALNYIATLTVLGKYTDSGLLLSLLLITRMAPRVILFPFVGVIVDRFDRRKLMIFSDLGRFFVVLAFLLVQSESSIWLLYLLSFLQFCFGALFEPSRSGLIAKVIKKEEFVTANTLDGTTWSCMTALASAIGGLITTYFGTNLDYLIDSFTYLSSIFLVLPLLFRSFPPSPSPSPSSSSSENESLLSTRDGEEEEEEEEDQLNILNNNHNNNNEEERIRRRKKKEERERKGEGKGEAEEDFAQRNFWIDINGNQMNSIGGNFITDSDVFDYVFDSSFDSEDEDEISKEIKNFEIIQMNNEEENLIDNNNNNLQSNSTSSSLNLEWNNRIEISVENSILNRIRNGTMKSVKMFLFGCYFLHINKYVIALALIKSTSQLIEGAVNTLNITFSQSVYSSPSSSSSSSSSSENTSSNSLGALYTILGLSTFLGPILAKRFGKETKTGTHSIFLIGYFILSFGTFALAFSTKIWNFLIINGIRASGTSILWVFASSMLQKVVVDEYRGRTLAFDLALSTMCQAAGTLLTGFLLSVGFDVYSSCLLLAILANAFFIFWISYFLYYSHHYSREISTPLL